VACDQQLTTLDAIGRLACHSGEYERRCEQREPHVAEVERLAGDGVDLPADRDSLHLQTDRGE
jgi:hypothetical protein